jgi:hypothetical protein
MLSVRRSFICLFGLLCSNTSVLSQQQVFPLANAGPEAVYVTLGTYLPCGGSSPVALYTVERREAAGWMNLGEVRMPASQDELADGIANAHVHLPHLHPPRSGLITSLWRTAVRTGRLDSLGFWGTSPLVQVALGAMFVDNSVEAGTYYEYRVTEVRVDGKQGRTIRSRPVRMPARPYPEKLRSIESEKTTSGFTLRWLINGSPPPAPIPTGECSR